MLPFATLDVTFLQNTSTHARTHTRIYCYMGKMTRSIMLEAVYFDEGNIKTINLRSSRNVLDKFTM